eukprot:298332-Chlamydomonas_euryale.AAC.4
MPSSPPRRGASQPAPLSRAPPPEDADGGGAAAVGLAGSGGPVNIGGEDSGGGGCSGGGRGGAAGATQRRQPSPVLPDAGMAAPCTILPPPPPQQQPMLSSLPPDVLRIVGEQLAGSCGGRRADAAASLRALRLSCREHSAIGGDLAAALAPNGLWRHERGGSGRGSGESARAWMHSCTRVRACVCRPKLGFSSVCMHECTHVHVASN